jgi:hypothetical protein
MNEGIAGDWPGKSRNPLAGIRRERTEFIMSSLNKKKLTAMTVIVFSIRTITKMKVLSDLMVQ